MLRRYNHCSYVSRDALAEDGIALGRIAQEGTSMYIKMDRLKSAESGLVRRSEHNGAKWMTRPARRDPYHIESIGEQPWELFQAVSKKSDGLQGKKAPTVGEEERWSKESINYWLKPMP